MPVSSKRDYWAALEAFDLEERLREALSPVDGQVNAAIACCDRHAEDEERIALRFYAAHGGYEAWTYRQLQWRSSQFAEVLRDLGIGKGDRVAGLLPRTPELLITILAIWRLGAVYQPLFTAFGAGAIAYRLREAATGVIVTDAPNRHKLDELDYLLPIVTVSAPPDTGDTDFWGAIGRRCGDILPEPCEPDDPFLMMFTSGTTGSAKGLYVPIRAIASFMGYLRDAADLRPDDRFLNLADPGWAYGLYYSVTGPLALGVATTFQEGTFSVERTYRIIEELRITNLAGSPTAFRLFMAAGQAAAAAVKGRLRLVSSAGEPLNPEVIHWFEEHLEVPIHDHYGQTELGMVLANHHGLHHRVTPGSAGFSIPGHRVVVVSPEGKELGQGQPGILALDRKQSPLMWFGGYKNGRTDAFVENYYLSGDVVERNDDGSISFIGRADDVITTSGYRVGPFDVESALIEHDAVLESAVIGKPDTERTEIIKAFVVLKVGYTPTPELAEAIKLHVRHRLSAHAYPREIEFVEALPKTPSGKVQRFLLRKHG